MKKYLVIWFLCLVLVISLGNISYARTTIDATRNVELPDGISTRPSLTFSNERTLGFYRSGNGVISLTGGTLSMLGGTYILSDADVAHGMTIVTATTNYGLLSAISGTDGGLSIQGLSDTDAIPLYIRGIIGSNNPTDTLEAISIVAAKKNGAGVQALGSAETVLQILNNTTELFTQTGDGSYRQPASTYHNFGATIGTSGYGFRDNASTGTLQYKNSGGSWSNLGLFGGLSNVNLIQEPGNPVVSPSAAEMSVIMDGTRCDMWYAGSPLTTVYYTYADDSSCNTYAAPVATDLTTTRFPYILKVGATYYAFGTHGPSTGSVYLWSSPDKVTWTELNSGNPVLTAGAAPYDDIANVGVVVVGTTWHMFIEANQVGLAYSYSTIDDMNWDTNRTAGVMISGAGNPMPVYVEDRNAIMIIHGQIVTGSTSYPIEAHYVSLADNLSLSASYNSASYFKIGHPGVTMAADPSFVLTPGKDHSILINYLYFQREIWQVYSDLSLNDFYDTIIAGVNTSTNYLAVYNAPTGVAPSLDALGSDADIDLILNPKNSGVVRTNSIKQRTPYGLRLNGITTLQDPTTYAVSLFNEETGGSGKISIEDVYFDRKLTNLNSEKGITVENISTGTAAGESVYLAENATTYTPAYGQMTHFNSGYSTVGLLQANRTWFAGAGGEVLIGTRGAYDTIFHTGGTADSNERVRIKSTGETIFSKTAFTTPLITKGPAIVNSGFVGTVTAVASTTVTFSSAADAILAGYNVTNPTLGVTLISNALTRYIVSWTNATTAVVDTAVTWAGTAITSIQFPEAASIRSNGTLDETMLAGGNKYFVSNVGIGITTPGITGNTRGLTISTGVTEGTAFLELQGKQTSGTGGSGGIDLYNQSTRVGVITNPREGADNSAGLAFYTASAGTLGERVRIDKLGNVGIKTDAPRGRLDIWGKNTANPPTALASAVADSTIVLADLSGSTGADIGVTLNGTSYDTYIQARNLGATSTSYNLLLQPLGGNVGIKTTAFGADLSGGLAIGNGTAATSQPENIVQTWAKDIVAGDSRWHFLGEAGNAIYLGNSVISGPGMQLVHTINKAASANVRNSHDAEATHTGDTVYTKAKTITLLNGLIGAARFLFDLKTSDAGTPTIAYGRIYRNGVALGTEQTDITGGYVTKSEDLTQTWDPGDTCELWVKIADGTDTVYVQNFRIAYDDSASVTVASSTSTP